MPGPMRRKKANIGITSENRKYKTKRRTRDIDLIVNDLTCPVARERIEKQPLDLDLPGGGQFYCIYCAQHFIGQHALDEHRKGKPHKKRVKESDEVPYTIEESERAAGLGTYIPPPAKRGRPNLTRPELMESEPIEVKVTELD